MKLIGFNLILLLYLIPSMTFAQNGALDKSAIPNPIFEENQDYVDLYWKAWELAWDHIKYQDGIPQSPYMDEAFSDEWIWIWDTCFMLHFCKYAPNVFPGIESLDNFYKPMHDGLTTNAAIHILDNPPLFAWTELEYYKLTNDKSRIEKLLHEQKYLQKHFNWFETAQPGFKLPNVKHYGICIKKVEDGYHWEGGRSGMDNTPRGRTGVHATKARPNNPKMLWIDAIAQQGLSASAISQLSAAIGDEELENEWLQKYNIIKDKINSLYWNEEDGIYYDINVDTKEHFKCKTPASYWPMLAGMCSKEQADKMADLIKDSDVFGGVVPWTTVSRDDADFVPENGNYWRGSVWLPTAYMGIKALEKYGYQELANVTSEKILKHMSLTYKNYTPHTIWECYSPSLPEPAKHGNKLVRPDFCGWSGLGPISLFIENVLGFYDVDAENNVVKWNKHHDTRHGIERFRFGNVTTSIIAEGDVVKVSADNPYTLVINDVDFHIEAGEQTLELKGVSTFSVIIKGDQNIKVFPNPTKDYLYIKGASQLQSNKFSINSIDGKRILKGDIKNVNGVYEVNISSLKRGVYIMKVGELYSVKVIKQRG